MAAWPLIGWDIFDFFSETAEWNSTELDRNQDLNALSSETAEPNSMKLNRKQDLNALYQVFFGPIRKTKWPPWPLIGSDIFDFSSETAERNSTKLDRKQALNAFYHVCVFQANQEKTKWPPWPLIGWDIFDFSSETAERNSTKLDMKQILKALYQVVVFQVDRKNKMAALAYDLLRHFQLFLWNRWIEFNKTWQEARSQHPLPGLRFSGWSEKQDSRPVLWLAETFLTSPMKPLNWIQRNLTESKFSTSSTKFVFFRLIQKIIWPPWPLIGWDIFWLFRSNHWTEFSETWQEARC